jgi:hypothetical protein
VESLLPVPSTRPTLRSSIYVAFITVIASVGIIEKSPWPVLVAAFLTLPASIAVVPCYYLIYGMLAQIPGANPSSNTGYEVQNADGTTITSVTTGAQAPWFVVTTQAVEIIAFTFAAVLSVLFLRALAARREGTGGAHPRRPH